MPTNDVRERRGVDDAHVRHAVHAQERVEHAARRARRHARRARRVVQRLDLAPHERVERGPRRHRVERVVERRVRVARGVAHPRERRRAVQPREEAHRAREHREVVLGREVPAWAVRGL